MSHAALHKCAKHAPVLVLAALGSVLALALACKPSSPGGASSATVVVAPPPSSAPVPAATPAPTTRPAAPADAAFVRKRPSGPEKELTGPDACAYTGWSGLACLQALLAEQDAVRRRYMRRLSDADARQALDALPRNEPSGVAHPELASSCKDPGPCPGDMNWYGYACLTKAEAALLQKDLATSRAAHEHACRCDPTGAQIPVMGGLFACDGKNKPVGRGKILTTQEAADVQACGVCDAEKGPAACAREVRRLATGDAALAKYIETVHVPRCQEP
ncbi:Hypothetical protein A7982_04041 [Minicystis rosea]|nr:Hypothetical protein A7982_04041 [Minicystis rosea]